MNTFFKFSLILIIFVILNNPVFTQELDSTSEYIIENLGPIINSPGVDYAPYITPDGNTLFFISDRFGSITNKKGGLSHDIWKVTKVTNNGFTFMIPENIDTSYIQNKNIINTDINEGVASFLVKDSILYYTTCLHPESLGNCDIFYSNFKNNQWSKGKNLGSAINSKYFDTQPSICADKKRIYFVSNRPSPTNEDGKDIQNLDIWYSDWDSTWNEWGMAKNFVEINTSGKECAPFIASDGITLYFSSDKYSPNYGGLDFYKIVYDSLTKKWSAPENLGKPFNTENDDMFLSIPSSGDVIYFSSKREDIPGKIGKMDIYRAYKKRQTFTK